MIKALCVGISRFADPRTRPLAGGANDALLLASMLQRHYGFKTSDLRLLTDESATKLAMEAGLEWLVAGAAPGDVLVFALATHGSRTIDRNAPTGPAGEVGGNERMFLTYDSSVSTYLLREEVAAKLDRVPPGANCYCIIDACDIGPFYYATRLDVPEEARRTGRADADVQCLEAANMDGRAKRLGRDEAMRRVEIMSCAGREQSFDLPEDVGKNGLFTHCLYKTLEEHSWDMTVGDVYEEVRNSVITLAESMQVKQTPQLRAPQHLMNTKIFS